MIRNSEKIKVFLKYYLPLLLWMGIVFYFSSIQGHGRVSNPDFWFYFQRKGAHVFEFFILTLLIWRVLKYYKIIGGKLYFSALVFAFSFAVSDEFHQIFVFGREGKLSDIAIDLGGIVLAIFIIRILNKK